MKALLTSCLLAVLQVCFCLSLRAQTPPAGFTSTTISTGWNEAVGLTFNSTGSKMFVWERPGKVWVVVNSQRQLVLDISPEVGAWEDHGLLGFALDPNFDSNGYMYLLYLVDRHYLLNFGTASYSATANDYNTASIGRLTRYTATPSGTGYTVNPASRRILLGATKTTGIPVASYTHSPGTLLFGADGTLLVSTGDGAEAPPDEGSFGAYYAQALADGILKPKENIGALRSQLVDCLAGKILRLDPATGDGIPSNPFYDAANPRAARSRVWALGTRNPFRMTRKPGTGSSDPAAANPGVLYLGDVGAANWEEMDVVDRPGVNLGWPLFEGLVANNNFSTSTVANQDAPNPLFGIGGCTKQFFTFPDLIRQATPTGTATFPNPCNSGQTIPASIPTFVHTRPLIDWGHPAGPSRTGIFSGSTATTINIGASGSPVSGPQFGGVASVGGVFYPYTDFPAQYQNTYFFGDYGEGWIRNLTLNGSNQPSAVRNFVNSGAVPVAFAVSPGETGLFYVNFFPSEIRKISYITAATPPVALASSNKTFGPAPLLVQFTGSASTNPAGGTLTYRWNFGDGTATSTAANPSHTFAAPSAAPITYTVTLTVTNSAGLTNQTSLTISVNNTPPQVTITSPAAGTLYPLTGPSTYPLRANVVDAEHSGGQLGYQWQTVLHHNTHQHPNPVDTTRQTSTTIAPYGCGTETYYYTVRLTVTDAGGLATTREVRLNPDCATTSFTLVDADAPEDVDIQPLVNGSVLNLATLPTRRLNIRANANPATTGSVVFALSGAQTQNVTDSGVPYALFGDVNGDYNSWTPAVGSYVLTATPYSGPSGSGTAGPPLTISFTVTDSNPPGAFTFYRAVNLGGPALTLDGNAWAGSTAPNYTTNGGAFANQAGPLVPATDAARAGMIRACVFGPGLSVALTAVPAGTYQAYLYVWEDSGPEVINLSLNGQAQLTNYSTGPAGSWARLGPYAVTLAAPGQVQFTSTGGWPNFSGVELWQQTGGTPTSYTLSTSTVGSGTVSKTPDAASYASGSTVSLTASPAADFTFAGWSGDATGSANPLSVSMSSNKTITATFTATGGGGGFTFYRAVNLGGPALTLDGNAWAGSTAPNYTTNGGAFANQAGPLLPATDAARAGMIRACVFGPGLSVALTAVPAGSYQAYLYVWEDSGPEVINLSLNGQAQLTNYSTGPAGSWARLGPYAVTLAAPGRVQFTSTGGWPNFSGVELWQQTGGTPTSYTLSTSTLGSGTVSRSPNAATYASGSTVSLTASPAAGFTFTGWSGDATGSANPLSVSMSSNKTITATFTATGGGGGFTFYRAVNLGGPALTLDGNAWAGSTAPNYTTNGGAFANQAGPLLPATDAARAGMIRACVFGPGLSVALTAVPAGSYQAYLYVWEDSGPEVINLSLNGQVQLTNYSTGPAGSWARLGPYAVTLAAPGQVQFTSTGGWPNFSGVELWQQTAARTSAARATAPSAKATASRVGEAVLAYPNPSLDGRFSVRLPAAFGGAVRYRLVSTLGATLVSGTLSAGEAPHLDFSRVMPATGLYYLQLETPQHTAQLKLLRQ